MYDEDDSDCSDEELQHEVFRDGKIHVLREKCASCIFRSVNDGRIKGLKPGRVAGMVQDSRAVGGQIPCHSTIWRTGVEPAICKGFYDLPDKPDLLQLAERMGVIEYDDPPPKETQ